MSRSKNPVRIVTATSLFDGHDASINIIRRILQDMGAEVIHLGHNRSVMEVVKTALQEGAQGIAISSYQGGHMEYFKYMRDLLDEAGADFVKIFGGGGGVIIHQEKKELEDYGITRIFHSDDGQKLGLEGMIEVIYRECDFDLVEMAQGKALRIPEVFKDDLIPSQSLGLAFGALETNRDVQSFKDSDPWMKGLSSFQKKEGASPPLVLGITGTGGAGKSSLIDELLQRFLNLYPKIKIGVVCVDPSKRKTGGSLLGDRIRMNSLSRHGTFMRSVASRGSGNEISNQLPQLLDFCKGLDFDFLIAESSGIGQASTAITEVADFSLYVMTSEFGAQSQLEKIDMIDYADFISVNKADHRGSQDALRDVTKQYRRSRKVFDTEQDVPVFLTQSSNFNDRGVNELFFAIVDKLQDQNKTLFWNLSEESKDLLGTAEKQVIVPPERQHYLAEVASVVQGYKKNVADQCHWASLLGSLTALEKMTTLSEEQQSLQNTCREKLGESAVEDLENYDTFLQKYQGEEFAYEVRGREVKQKMVRESLAGLNVPRICVPQSRDWGDRLKFLSLENFPGYFPFTAGVFPLKREGEDPLRQFAGEGPPEKTNKRFHYLCEGSPVKRLSTAFDSVTLYGEDPNPRPDIFGKVGESGVSIATLEDMKTLYAGFDLCDPKTSVSMTINGPAPMILAFFMNTAIDQQVEKKTKELGRELSDEEFEEVRALTLSTVRGTVQADILKEDQGQNTCIFSIDFALKMMADIQQYFIDAEVRNFYSVSISGYHIAEAGANPITQLALTLSNAFTFVEYYLSRGMKVDEFAPNFSFFFSNGLDPEYTVIGRVARRIWSVVMKELYGGNDRSQKLKYHIQTSGRSLHAQEIAFNDIRTTLQALLAINDNCNSLHTNAYDEAITTPTEESVRRAQAIQMIINKEFGQAKNENPLQGSYFTEWLTDAVEEKVLEEFVRISERGGVLGAMETQYQRGKIQEESMYYEQLKHSGQLPIVGVNTFTHLEEEREEAIPLTRSTQEEKQKQVDSVNEYQNKNHKKAQEELAKLQKAALQGENIFEALMSTSRHCSLYQMTNALYEVGGQYRRNL